MSSRTWILVVLSLCLLTSIASGAGPTRRFILAAGANSGGQERVPLRYAVSDAAQFADVMMKMGGVDPADHQILREPNREEFGEALDRLRDQVSLAAEDEGRTEVLIYYSGHADEEGLLLGEERLPYGQLREMMDAVPSDVRITVLDACASGAITRIKGGQRRQAFLVPPVICRTSFYSPGCPYPGPNQTATLPGCRRGVGGFLLCRRPLESSGHRRFGGPINSSPWPGTVSQILP